MHTRLAARHTLRILALLGLIGAGASLSGCYYVANAEVPGVPLDELNLAGKAPYEISVAGPDDVVLTAGETLDISVDGDRDGLKFDLSDESLSIARENDWSGTRGATIRVTMPAPRQISIAGSGDVSAAEIAKDAQIDIAGSGNVTVAAIDADRLEIGLFGNGGVTGEGSAASLEV